MVFYCTASLFRYKIIIPIYKVESESYIVLVQIDNAGAIIEPIYKILLFVSNKIHRYDVTIIYTHFCHSIGV